MTGSLENGSEKLSTKQVGRGVMWSYLTFVVGKVMVFISTVILARILTPEDFGLVGLASVLAGYLGTLHALGAGEAFIQSKASPKVTANVTFVFSMASGIVLFLFSVLITPFVVTFFQEPRIRLIFPALASTYILTGFTVIHDALLVKELHFQERLIPTLAQSIGKGVTSIVLALMGFGAWAIVWGVLVGTLIKSIILIMIKPWKPSRDWDSQVMRNLFGFGKFIALQNILGALEENVDYLIIGRRLGTADLGLYKLGYQTPELTITSLPSVIASVVFPAYTKLQDDREALQRSVYKTMEIVSWLVVPAGVGLAMISSAFVLTFYTEKWAAAIIPMQLLSLYAMVYTVTYNFGDAYKAIGRPDILNKLSLSTIVLTIFALWIGSYYGIVGVAWGHLIRVTVIGAVQVMIVKNVLGVSPAHIVSAIFKPLFSAGLMALGMWAIAWSFQGSGNGLILVLQLVLGLLTYLAAAFVFNRSVTVSMFRLVLKIAGGKPAESVLST
ncbi:MAG: lipopolysaccharide biosynthesis protein [Chloroflexi bacterium]|nr:lipopolysaccharide biosynthesis protein [Chloroflexota bacterium]